jgi:hypothetical protein
MARKMVRIRQITSLRVGICSQEARQIILIESSGVHQCKLLPEYDESRLLGCGAVWVL